MTRNAGFYDAQDDITYERAVARQVAAHVSKDIVLGRVATGQVTSHVAASPVVTSDMGVERWDGGARQYHVIPADVWRRDPNGIPYVDAKATQLRAQQLRRDAALLDLAIKRGDDAAVAIIETRLGFGYEDRFSREGHTHDTFLANGECEGCWLASK